ncbi:MAG: ABC transporter permease [Gammaproteobacteria bacterium]|nr:ABC transporter permease [Gammaproteobacteria bacterium]
MIAALREAVVRGGLLTRIGLALFAACFFVYLFGPLVLMGITAFNSSAFPRVSPWECFSVEWFEVLRNDQTLVEGLRNSVFIGIGVVALAVPIGLAGALMLMQINQRVRPWYYTVVISPILVPGVVLGISTLVFWDRVGIMFNASHETFFYNGFFLTIVGQATFISAYSMLVFISRLQRFDPALEEAALDLGATHVQTFRKVLLPFLKPAIASAAVLAFLASFENYNTTVFTIVSESTLTTVLASKVRYGINPSISALAVIIVVVTLLGAAVFEVVKRREQKAARESEKVARGEVPARARRKPLLLDPAMFLILAVFVAGLGTVYFAGTVGIEECKAAVKEEKQRVAQERVRKLQQQRMFQRAAPVAGEGEGEGGSAPAAPQAQREDSSGFESIFAPQNLKEQVESGPPAAGTESFQGIFAPENLESQSGAGQ